LVTGTFGIRGGHSGFGIDIHTYATFRNLVLRNMEATDPYLIQSGFTITFSNQ
jgi:hypothetical protein